MILESTPAPKRTALGRHSQNLIRETIAYVLLSLGGASMFLPFFWLVTSALKDPKFIYVFPPQWIPLPPHWENFYLAVTTVPAALFAANTAIITVGAMAGILITASMAGYAFSRLEWPGRDTFFLLILSTLMLPSAVTLVPSYLGYRYLGWLDTYLPLIVPAWFGGGPFNIFLIRQFMLTIPLEIENAARVDGASARQSFSSIVLPLCKPALAIVAIFSFLYHWNDFMGPLIYLTSNEKYTLSLGLNYFKDEYTTQTELMMAASTLMVLPEILIFFVAQRYFIQGIVLTGLKG